MAPSLLAAALLLMTAQDAPDERPVRLVIAPQTGGVIVQVVGNSAHPVVASYALEAAGGGNRTTQRGTARLQPNVPVTLMTLTLTSGQEWSARLRVEPADAEPYEDVRSGSADGEPQP